MERKTLSIEEITARKVYVEAQIKALKEEEDAIKARLREHFQSIGSYSAGEWTVQLQPNRQLDREKFMQAYPPAANPELYQVVPKMTAVNHYIAKADLEEFYINGDAKVVVK